MASISIKNAFTLEHHNTKEYQTDQKLLWSLWNNANKANSDAQTEADYIRASYKAKKALLPINYETRSGFCKLSIGVDV